MTSASDKSEAQTVSISITLVEKDKKEGTNLQNAEFKSKGAISAADKDAIIARAIANAKK